MKFIHRGVLHVIQQERAMHWSEKKGPTKLKFAKTTQIYLPFPFALCWKDRRQERGNKSGGKQSTRIVAAPNGDENMQSTYDSEVQCRQPCRVLNQHHYEKCLLQAQQHIFKSSLWATALTLKGFALVVFLRNNILTTK